MKIFTTPKGTQLPIEDIKGKDYLKPVHRIAWLREEHPDYSVTTECKLQGGCCLAECTIRDADGNVLANAHKFESKDNFGAYIEKAETGAIGRALMVLGYGTQFDGGEMDEGDEVEKLSDSPVTRHSNDNTAPLTDDNGKEYRCVVPKCNAIMKLSKKGTSYYCPNFKKTAMGEHLGRFKNGDLMAPRAKPPEPDWSGIPNSAEPPPFDENDSIPF